MTLISKLKALLGLEPRRRDDRSTTVTVEREPPAESEQAVEESEPPRAPVEPEREPPQEPASEPRAEPEPEPAPQPEPEPEPQPEPEPEPEPPTELDEGDAEPAPNADAPVQSISGIGPAYAERLSEAGVDTVGELAAADPAELAEATGVGEARVSSWIERASGG